MEANSQPTQEGDTDLYSRHLALILEIIPDVEPEYAMEQIKMLYPVYADEVVEEVIQSLFDGSSYPQAKRDEKGKGKPSEMDEVLEGPSLRAEVDFTSIDRPKPTGNEYQTLALNQLFVDFPSIPVAHVRHVFDSNNGLYVPTHIQLTTGIESPTPPFALNTAETAVSATPGVSLRKGKQKEMRDDDFEEEREWLLLNDVQAVHQGRAPGETGSPVMDLNVLREEEEDYLECECCFSYSPYYNMTQCPDTHIFCKDCIVTYASNLLGERDFKIVCMSQSGCKLPFPESELKRVLTPKLLSLYEKVKQTKEIEMAGLQGLEECPHCDFKAVIDDPVERLLRCQNEECMAKTCRQCKRPDHLPKSCAEADEDNRTNACHVVEEAMTDALLWKCPKCNKAFIKEFGCNVVTCRNCKTISCYVCRQIIPGHSHFNNRNGAGPANTCELWDNIEERHDKEVEEARKKAVAECQKEHPEMGDDALQIKVAEVLANPGVGDRARRVGVVRVFPRLEVRNRALRVGVTQAIARPVMRDRAPRVRVARVIVHPEMRDGAPPVRAALLPAGPGMQRQRTQFFVLFFGYIGILVLYFVIKWFF